MGLLIANFNFNLRKLVERESFVYKIRCIGNSSAIITFILINSGIIGKL